MSFSIILSGTEKVKICHRTSRGGWKSDGGSPLHRLQISASFFGATFRGTRLIIQSIQSYQKIWKEKK